MMGQLNIAEKRLPQDGRIRIKLAGRDIDIRLSTIPCTFGERIVMRLLDKNTTLLDLTDIGMARETMLGDGRGHQALPRHHPGHRPHRLGEDHHALRGAEPDQHART